jgi:hypothetical protein
MTKLEWQRGESWQKIKSAGRRTKEKPCKFVGKSGQKNILNKFDQARSIYLIGLGMG